MNARKVLNVMPYVLGVLILVLIGVIAVSKLGNNTGSGKEEEAVPTGEAAVETTPEPVTEQPEPTKAEPTSTPVPTEEPTPTPEPVAEPDLTFGYTFEDRADYVDLKAGINLRKGCSTDTEKVDYLENAERLERTGYNKDWTRVIYKGQVCYVATFLVTGESESLDAVSSPAPVQGADE